MSAIAYNNAVTPPGSPNRRSFSPAVKRTFEKLERTSNEIHASLKNKLKVAREQLVAEQIRSDSLEAESRQLKLRLASARQKQSDGARQYESIISNLENEVWEWKQKHRNEVRLVEEHAEVRQVLATEVKARNEKVEELLRDIASLEEDLRNAERDASNDRSEMQSSISELELKLEKSKADTKRVEDLLAYAHRHGEKLESRIVSQSQSNLEQVKRMQIRIRALEKEKLAQAAAFSRVSQDLQNQQDENEKMRERDVLLREKLSSLHLENEQEKEKLGTAESMALTSAGHCKRLDGQLRKAKSIIEQKDVEIKCLVGEIDGMLERHTESMKKIREAFESRMEEEKGHRLKAMRRVRELESKERSFEKHAEARARMVDALDERLEGLVAAAERGVEEASPAHFIPGKYETVADALDRRHVVGIRVPSTFSMSLRDELVL